MSPLIEELRQLVAVFNERGIDFALCGGLAVAAHGLVRAGLIKMKQQAGRPQDPADIDRLENEGS
ncbi:MAG TPA: hypothetical protein VHL50_01665 [Pyrinomonadaceae bacterium]|nr:hypothetical protein [Pyrinomonadaceae bacterium]